MRGIFGIMESMLCRLRTPSSLLLAALALLALLPRPVEAQSSAELLEEIRQRRDTVNMGIFDRLARMGGSEALENLKVGVGYVRNRTVLDAGYGAFRNFIGQGELEKAARDFVASQTDAGYEPTRRAATRGLSFFGVSASAELHRIVERSRDEECRAWAIGPLLPQFVATGGEAELALALDQIQIGPSGPRPALLEHLKAFSKPEHVPVFGARIADRKKADLLKVLFIEAVAANPDAAVAQVLRSALKEKSAAVQFAALTALTERSERAHAADLRALLRSDDAALRRLAVVSLARIRGEEESWPAELLALSEDRHPATRMGAAAALGELRTAQALERLHAMLGDTDPSVRAEVLLTVGSLRRKHSIPVLIARVNGETGRAKHDLLTVLRLLTGLDQGTSYERWKRWWEGEGEAFALPTYEDALAIERRRAQKAEDGRTVTAFYGLRVVSDRVCFVLDISGSMSTRTGGGRSRVELAREELARSLEGYPDGDLFNLIFFSSDVMAWQDRLVAMDAKTRAAAVNYVLRQTAGGATAVYDALERAFEDERIDTIFLLTDGAPAGGTVDDPAEILASVRRWNSARHVRIHTISIGTESGLLRDLSRETGGEYRSIRD